MARQDTSTRDDTPAKKRTSPAQFLREVRQEASKITWPSRRETMISTMMVFIMIIIMALFFMGVDTVLRFGIGRLLGLGSGAG